jgi:hypothetical protein
MSPEEFLACEREQPERYEWAGGVITLMTGRSAARVTIALSPSIAFAPPDISVTCASLSMQSIGQMGSGSRDEIALSSLAATALQVLSWQRAAAW